MSGLPSTRVLDRSEATIPPGHAWHRIPAIGVAIGAVGTVASFAMAPARFEQFYFSWLVAFLFALSLALGALFFVLIQFASKAAWSVVVRRLAEDVMATLPLFALLFLPVAVGIPQLFMWADPEKVAGDALLQGKQGYLNVPFFLIRAAFYFAAWTGLSLWFMHRSARQDETGGTATTLSLIRASAPALFVFAITTTFAGVDWIMSLDPHWYSSIFGVYWFAGCLVGVFAFLSLLSILARRAGLLARVITAEHFHDLGKHLFGFTVFWAYIGFSQFFLIWYANIPEETVWYRHRLEGSWRTVTLTLAIGHFAVPFLFLMSRNIKRRLPLLAAGAVWLLAMHYLDLHWLVMPTLHHEGFHLGVLDLTTLLAVLGWFLAVLGWQMRRRALVPLRDPRLAQSLGFENA